MGPGFRRIVLASLVFVLIAASSPLGFARAQERGQGGSCAQSSTGATPISDLGEGLYMGAEGGLYPNGSNMVPDDHASLGLWHASQIEPLDPEGNPDPNGEIVLVSLGVSNTWREFDSFSSMAQNTKAANVTLVNGAQAGEPIVKWIDPNAPTWNNVDSVLAASGLSPEQVQAAWVKMPETIRTWDEVEPFPVDAETYQADLEQVLRNAKDRYPNMQIAYLSSRIYGGYSTSAAPSPEPLTYENGFGVKWAIERQIDGAADLNHDPRAGDVVAPWLAWGPYLWADGTTPRSDGLTWECSDLRRDGTHPSPNGVTKAGRLVFEHFVAAPTAVPWFTADGEPVDVGELPEVQTLRGSPAPSDGASVTTTPRERRDRRSTSTTIASSTTIDPEVDESGVEDQPQAARESEGPASPRTASASLILVAVVLAIGAALGVAAIVASRGRNEE